MTFSCETDQSAQFPDNLLALKVSQFSHFLYRICMNCMVKTLMTVTPSDNNGGELAQW